MQHHLLLLTSSVICILLLVDHQVWSQSSTIEVSTTTIPFANIQPWTIQCGATCRYSLNLTAGNDTDNNKVYQYLLNANVTTQQLQNRSNSLTSILANFYETSNITLIKLRDEIRWRLDNLTLKLDGINQTLYNLTSAVENATEAIINVTESDSANCYCTHCFWSGSACATTLSTTTSTTTTTRLPPTTTTTRFVPTTPGDPCANGSATRRDCKNGGECVASGANAVCLCPGNLDPDTNCTKVRYSSQFIITRPGHIYSPINPNDTLTASLTCTWVIYGDNFTLTAIRFITNDNTKADFNTDKGRSRSFSGNYSSPSQMALLQSQLNTLASDAESITIRYTSAPAVNDGEYFDILANFRPSNKKDILL